MKKKSHKKAPFMSGIVVLLAIFILPMYLSSAIAIPTMNTNTSPISDYKFQDVEPLLQDWNEYYDSSKLDNLLTEWVESKDIPAGIMVNEKKVSIMLLTTGTDKTFGGLIEPVGSIILNEDITWIHALVSSIEDLRALTLDPAVKMIQADEILENAPVQTGHNLELVERGTPMEFPSVEDEFPVDTIPPIDIFSTRDLIGATYVQDNYGNGTTSVIQIQDSGVDLGHTAFTGAQLIDANGNPMSMDPTGRGFAISQLVSYDFWEDPAFLAPLHSDSNGNIDISSIKDSLVTYMPDYGSFSYGIGENLTDLYHVGSIPGNSTGYLFGIVHSVNGYGTYNDTFIPFILVDGNDDNDYDTLYLDFDAGYNLTLWWNWKLSDEEFNAIEWDFEDEVAKTNGGDTQLAADLENETHGFGYIDGFNDISVGGLSTSLDHIYNKSENTLPLIHGINPNGRVFAHMWDSEGHGTSCAANALGRSVEYEVFKNAGIDQEGTYDLKGIAPDAKLIAGKGYSEAEVFYSWTWAAGFEPIDEDNTWEFVPGSGHAANISSNSWGYSDFHFNGIVGGFDFTTMLLDYLSVPGYIDPEYPGILMMTSSGNGGPGTGTNRQGGQSPLALMVGASTNNWIRQLWGYPYEDQPADQIISWSDAGPNNFGYPTLDVVNVGAFDFSVNPVDWTRPETEGGYYNYDYFGGTSQACPMTAGVMGLIYDAWTEVNPSTPLNPMVAKTIIKSTAKDLGYDVYHQGNGRVDARKAIDYINGSLDINEDEILRAQTNESIENIVDRFELAYFRYFGDDHPALTNETIDGSLYGGALLPGESIDIDFDIDGNLTQVDISDFTLETNYTEQNDSLYTYANYSDFNIFDVFNETNLLNVDFFQLTLGFSFDEINKAIMNDVREPILYVQGFDGENRTFINYAYNAGNMQTLFLPTDFLKSSGDFTIQIRVRDDGWNDIQDWTGLEFSLAIRAFNRVNDTRISVSEIDSNTLRATITTDTDQIPGMYGGCVVVNTTANNQILIPYGYSVISNVSEMNENGWTEISGITNRLNDNGMYGAIDWSWRPDTGDWRYYDFVFNTSGFTNEDPNTLLLEVEWELEGSVIDCWVVDAAGYVVEMTDYVTASGEYISYVNTPDGVIQRLLVDMHGFVDGTWTEPYENHTNSGLGWDIFSLVLHSSATELNESTLALEPFSIRMAWIDEGVSEFITPTASFSVPGDQTYEGSLITNGSLTVGWTDADNNYGYETDVYDVNLFPGHEINIYETCEPYNTSYYEVYLEEGDFAIMNLGWNQPETDLDFYLFDPNDNEVAYAASLSNPEIIQYHAPISGIYILEVEYYSGIGTPYEAMYDIIVHSAGEDYWFMDIPTGTDLEIDFAAEGIAEASYFVYTYTYGWNFNYISQIPVIYVINEDPTITSPDNVSYMYEETEQSIEWTITDYSVSDNRNYIISVDGTEEVTGIWTSGTTYTFDITGWEIGEYEVVISVNDGLGGSVSDTVNVIVSKKKVPGYAIGLLLVSLLGTAIFLIKKHKK